MAAGDMALSETWPFWPPLSDKGGGSSGSSAAPAQGDSDIGWFLREDFFCTAGGTGRSVR